MDEYKALRAYFLTPDVRAAYTELLGEVDEAELAKVHQLHAQFIQHLPRLIDVRKEKYFTSQFEPQWVERRAEARRLIASKKRRIEAMGPDQEKHIAAR